MDQKRQKNAQVLTFATPDLTAEFAAFPDASDDHPYLLAQPVRSHGLKQNDRGNLLVPVCVPASGRVVGWEEIKPLRDNPGEVLTDTCILFTI